MERVSNGRKLHLDRMLKCFNGRQYSCVMQDLQVRIIGSDLCNSKMKVSSAGKEVSMYSPMTEYLVLDFSNLSDFKHHLPDVIIPKNIFIIL